MQRLEQGTVFRLERAAGARIIVRAGRIWLTESASPDDVFLSAGQQHVVGGQGCVVIEPYCAAAAAVFDIVPRGRRQPPARPARPRAAWLRERGA